MLRQKLILMALVVLMSLSGFCLNGFPSDIPAVEIKAQANPQTAFIGDIIDYKISLTVPPGAETKIQEGLKNKIGVFGVKKFKQKEKHSASKKQLIVLEYKLAAYEAGKIKIPEYVILCRYPGETKWSEVKSNSLEINIQSLIAGNKNPALKPLKAKFGVWQNWLWRAFLFLLIAAGIIAAIFFWRRRKKQIEKTIPLKPAHVIAYEELETLKKLKLLERGFFKEFFARLSDCMRRYMENRFNLRAPWMSTEEFLESAKSSAVLDSGQRSLLKDFLELCDLVKFARYGSSLKEADDSFAAVKNFIDNTKEKEIKE